MYGFARGTDPLVNMSQPYWVNAQALKYVDPSWKIACLSGIGQIVRGIPPWKLPVRALSRGLNGYASVLPSFSFLELGYFRDEHVQLRRFSGSSGLAPPTGGLSASAQPEIRNAKRRLAVQSDGTAVRAQFLWE